jgi:hypothetical protein
MYWLQEEHWKMAADLPKCGPYRELLVNGECGANDGEMIPADGDAADGVFRCQDKIGRVSGLRKDVGTGT